MLAGNQEPGGGVVLQSPIFLGQAARYVDAEGFRARRLKVLEDILLDVGCVDCTKVCCGF